MRHVLRIVASDAIGDVDDAVGVVAKAVDDDAFGQVDIRNPGVDDRNDDDVLVKHAGAFDTGPQCEWDGRRVAVRIHRHAGHADGLACGGGDELVERSRHFAAPTEQDFRAALPPWRG